MKECLDCQSNDIIKLVTYKREWFLCNMCGNARPKQRNFYPLSWLPICSFKKDQETPEAMYDYFVAENHIEHSIKDAERFINTYIKNQIDLNGKKILDISAGNGHFIHAFKQLGAQVYMTEINPKALEYGEKKLNIQSFGYNFQKDNLEDVVQMKFDVIMLRAALMFCLDLPKLISELKQCLTPKGLIIVEHSVLPTIGVLTRVQLDEYSYEVLRQPENVINLFKNQGFELLKRNDETDPSDYVYDHDLKNSWLFLHYLYEIKNILTLKNIKSKFSFRARDRKRSALFFIAN